MGQALYRKYRSKSLAEVVGQEHITDTLSQALKNGRISHAYLFTGPRGVGKTSIARILAHELNGLSYTQEDSHIDIIEIDAASNRGIDEIRDLREKVYSAPLSAKYKVYIIDEVHMLTTPAFNALLKTLEEPPEHVIFILATTEVHKLPETIISRTQRHIFRPVELAKVIAHLRFIAKSEGIKIDDEALALLAAHGDGSFRDSISLLDQAGSGGQKIDRSVAESLLGIPPNEQIDALLAAVRSGNAGTIMSQLEQLINSGYQASAIAKQISSQLRAELVADEPRFTPAVQLSVLQDLLEVASSADPLRRLEIGLLKAAPLTPAIVATAPVVTPKPEPPKTRPVNKTPPKEVESEPQAVAKAVVPATGASTATLDPAIWDAILQALKKKYNTLYGVMRMAVPEFEPGLLRLRFQFAFHQKRMNEAKHRAIVSEIIEQLTGQAITIECVHDKEALLTGPIGAQQPAVKAESGAAEESLSAISNIFGGGELLES
jgi:DNA polymerase-3 subunit gamma/tau